MCHLKSWWFLKRYTSLRHSLISEHTFKVLSRLGEKAFESAQAAGEIVGLTIIGAGRASPDSAITLYDVSNTADTHSKAILLQHAGAKRINQIRQLDNKDYALHFKEICLTSFVSDSSTALQGLVTGDSFRFFRKFWEQNCCKTDWEFLQTTSSEIAHYRGMTDAIFWQKESGELAALAKHVKGRNHSAQNWRKGKPNWGKSGVVVSQMGTFQQHCTKATSMIITAVQLFQMTQAMFCLCGVSAPPRNFIQQLDPSIKIEKSKLEHFLMFL